MDTIRCGVVHGKAIQKIQELKDAIDRLASSDDDYDFVIAILRIKLNDIWDRCIANTVHEYPVGAYRAFVNSEIGTRKENT